MFFKITVTEPGHLHLIIGSIVESRDYKVTRVRDLVIAGLRPSKKFLK